MLALTPEEPACGADVFMSSLPTAATAAPRCEQGAAMQNGGAMPGVPFSSHGGLLESEQTEERGEDQEEAAELSQTPIIKSQGLGTDDSSNAQMNLLRDDARKKKRKRARQACADWLLGTRIGQFFLLFLVGAAQVTLGTIAWALFGGNDDYDRSFWHSLWISWGLFFDPGTQTGIPATDPGRIWTIAVFFSFFGFLFNLTLLGTLVETVRSTLARWMKRRNRFVLTGHTLVLGWTDKTLYLLREKLAEAYNLGIKRMVVLIVAERDEADMSQEVYDYFDGDFGDHVVFYRKGQPFNPSDLAKVSVGSARDIVILGRNHTSRSAAAATPQESDLEVLQILAALGSLDEEIHGRIVAEVRQGDTTPIMETFLPECSNAEGIFARGSVDRMLILMATKPELGICFATFCSFGPDAAKFYATRVSAVSGRRFGEARAHFDRAVDHSVVVGIKSPGQPLEFAPPDDRVIGDQDKLLILARGYRAISENDSDESRDESVGFVTNKVDSVFNAGENITRMASIQLKRMPYIGSGASQLFFEEDWTGAVYKHNSDDVVGPIFIMAGWPSDSDEIVKALDTFSPPGSVLHVLSEQPEQDRVIGKALSKIQLQHHVGARTSVASLLALPMRKARTILIMAETQSSSGISIDPMTSDTESLACAAMILGVNDGKYGQEHQGCLEGQLICEILCARTDRLLQKKPKITHRCVFFRSNALEMGMFAMAASQPVTFNALVMLLMPNGRVELRSEPASTYLHDADSDTDSKTMDRYSDDGMVRISARELSRRVRGSDGRGGILMGWQRGYDKPELMPAADHRTMSWALDDKLLVIRRRDPKMKPDCLDASVRRPRH